MKQYPDPKTWHPAEVFDSLKAELDAVAPHRLIKNPVEGAAPNGHHLATGIGPNGSDHNPDKHGTYHAYDVSARAGDPQDPMVDGYVNGNWLVATLLANPPPWLHYIIWNHHIYNAHSIDGAAPWAERRYTLGDQKGQDPHETHVHLSIWRTPEAEKVPDRPWLILPPNAGKNN